MAVVDSRLLDCSGEMEITENFNRVQGLVDGLAGAVTCTVRFDSDGGSDVAAQNVAFGDIAQEPVPPTKAGNIFAGWFLGEQVYDFQTPVTASITLTARWTAES